MKKTSRLRVVIVILTVLLSIGLSYSTEAAGLTEAEQKKLESLERDTLNSSFKKNILTDQITDKEEELKSATGPREADLKEEIDSLKKSVAEIEKEMKKTEQDTNAILKLKKIEEDYQERIKRNETKSTELVNDRDKSCPNLTPAECSKYQLRITGNNEYGEFLKAKQSYDLCMERNKAEGQNKQAENCKTQKAAVDSTATAVRATVKILTEAEKEENKKMTFQVSKFFSLTEEGEGGKTVQTVANQIADWMITLASSLAVTALIIGGFMMVVSAADEERLNQGKEIFQYALIGLAVTLLAYAIIITIQGLFYR